MAFFHRTRSSIDPTVGHLNWMGGRSWDIADPVVRLRIAAASCFFGEPMYYHQDLSDTRPVRASRTSTLDMATLKYLRETLHAVDPDGVRACSPAERMEQAIDAALDADPEATLAEAARLRNEEHIRTTPQVILVRAAHHARVRGTGLIRRFAPEIIRRADEPAVGLAYEKFRYGGPIPNALKRAWRAALESADDHVLAKYRLESRAVKTVDVMNLVHPRSASIDRLARGGLRTTDRTWESVISAQGSNRAAWESALPLMGHMALLRNLRNLAEAGVPPRAYLDTLLAGVKTGKQLPFRYYSAWCALEGVGSSGREVRKALEKCLETAIGNVPRLPGRVMSLCDNSGSAQGTKASSMGTMKVSTIANLTGLLAGHRADEGWLGVFGDRLDCRRVERRRPVFEQLAAADEIAKTIGMGTENGIWLFWDHAIRSREHWDTVFVFSDMQAGHGGLYGTNPSAYADYLWRGSNHIDVAKLIATYRARVNANVQVFLVQVAGYQDTLVPDAYDRTYILGGWSEGLLRYAAMMASQYQA